MKTSFGKYFDDQRDKFVKDMQTGKNTELNNAWREDFDKRQEKKKQKWFKKELQECSEKGVEISEECKVYYNKQYEHIPAEYVIGQEEDIRLAVLKDEVDLLQKRYNPATSKINVLYITDTISMLRLRIAELQATNTKSPQ
jgi:hypothetical protein